MWRRNLARDRNYEGISWKSWPTRADKVSGGGGRGSLRATLGRDACDFGRDPKVFSKVGKRARSKLILGKFGKKRVYRHDYFKAILPSRKYLNDRSVDGRGGDGEARLDWNAAKAKLLTGEGGKYRVDPFCRLRSIAGVGVEWMMERDARKTRLVRKLQSVRMVKLL